MKIWRHLTLGHGQQTSRVTRGVRPTALWRELNRETTHHYQRPSFIGSKNKNNGQKQIEPIRNSFYWSIDYPILLEYICKTRQVAVVEVAAKLITPEHKIVEHPDLSALGLKRILDTAQRCFGYPWMLQRRREEMYERRRTNEDVRMKTDELDEMEEMKWRR